MIEAAPPRLVVVGVRAGVGITIGTCGGVWDSAIDVVLNDKKGISDTSDFGFGVNTGVDTMVLGKGHQGGRAES